MKVLAGGVGEFAVVDQEYVYRLPDSVDLIRGALVEPMAVCYHAIKAATLGPESTVVIAGAGPIGIGLFLGLKSRGITRIVISEPVAERRATAERLGATTVDPLNDDLKGAVSDLSAGLGASVFFDAAGAQPVFQQGLDLLGPLGQYVMIAVHTKPLTFEPFAVQWAENRIITCMAYGPEDYEDVIAAMAEGAFPTDGWVDVRPASDLVEAIQQLRLGNGGGTKILLDVKQIQSQPATTQE
jgi:(R,R)-butanediol dehydrogenase/meso-butanediol dehydrogenase/diacetyl reductase